MEFKVKDLMIKVISEDLAKKPGECPNACSWESSCKVTVCDCTACTDGCTLSKSIGPDELAESLQHSLQSLSLLKVQLEQHLAQVDAQKFAA